MKRKGEGRPEGVPQRLDWAGISRSAEQLRKDWIPCQIRPCILGL
jgi:hypothetical protein